jgi:hypothetical protein
VAYSDIDCFGVSSTADFYPELDDPESFDGDTITWTFQLPRQQETGAGIYRIQFVRILTREEKDMPIGKVLASANTGSPSYDTPASSGDTGMQGSPPACEATLAATGDQ